MKRLLKPVAWTLLFLGTATLFICIYYLKRFDGHCAKSILPNSGHSYYPEKSVYKFAVIGDFNIRTQGLEYDFQAIKDNYVDFVISTGDIGHKPGSISSYNWLAERLENALGNTPFFPTPGNHDRESKIVLDDGMKAYKTVFGNPDYWFSFGETLFISLNSAREIVTDESLSFLEQTLKDQRGRYKGLIVFSHVPPIDLRNGTPDSLPKDNAERVHHILSQYAPTLYLCGHQHCFSQWDFNGIPLVVTAASGQKSRSQEHGNGFLIVTMNKNQVADIQLKEMKPCRMRSTQYWLSTKLNLTYFPVVCAAISILIGTILLSQSVVNEQPKNRE